VAVGNTADVSAHVKVTRGADDVTTATVAQGSMAVIKLPWVLELKGGDVDACQNPPPAGASRVVPHGAYRLRSDVPITVYQLSPLTYEIDPPPADCPVGTQCGGVEAACKSFSNDASLLMPKNALTCSYVGLSWPSTKDRAAFFAITATEDDTEVDFGGRGAISPGGGIDATGMGKVTLAAGDVLEVLASAADIAKDTFGADPSGSVIHAARPVQVIAGHSCANVPQPTTGYCDHLEPALFPIETLGKDYIVSHPAAVASESPQVVRIAAVAPNTHVTFDPKVMPDQVIGPSDSPLLIESMQDFRVSADQAVLIAQYMQGSTSVPSGSGDPSMSLVVPSAQFRTDYVFVASSTYDSNFVNVIAPAGAAVTLDGATVAGGDFVPVGTSGFGVAREALMKTDAHRITSTSPFGIVVYGYGKDTSYMYPGGLDLKRITEPPVR